MSQNRVKLTLLLHAMMYLPSERLPTEYMGAISAHIPQFSGKLPSPSVGSYNELTRINAFGNSRRTSIASVVKLKFTAFMIWLNSFPYGCGRRIPIHLNEMSLPPAVSVTSLTSL
jgi:hypothetical protein